jgi:hypothetical protein
MSTATVEQQAQMSKQAPELTVEQLRRFRFVTVMADRSWGVVCTNDKELMFELFPDGEGCSSCVRDTQTDLREHEKRFGRATVENALIVMRERGQLPELEEAA